MAHYLSVGEIIMNPTNIKVVVVSTMDEVVQDILETLTEGQKADIRSKSKEDLIMYHHGWGTNIRNRYLLWHNEELLKNIGKEDADDASMVIIEAVWEALKIGDDPP